MGRTLIGWVRTTFGGYHQVGNLILLCNPPKWDAPRSRSVIDKMPFPTDNTSHEKYDIEK
jgi:hypothetical protein